MRNILLLNTLLFIFVCQSSFAQHAKPYNYELKGYIDSNKISLRWAPVDFMSWQAGNEHGYKLTRFFVSENGQKIPIDTVRKYALVLLDSVKPLPENQWESKADSSNFAGIAAGALYGDSLNIVEGTESSMSRIVNLAQQNDSRFSFSLMAAEMDFDVAKDLALGFVDTTAIIPGRVYLYSLTLGSGMDSLVDHSGTYKAELDTLSELKSVDSLEVISGDKMVTISWPIPDISEYSAYNIERSTDGINYSKINQQVIVPVIDKNAVKVNYIDTLASNQTEYIYRVRGINSFGMEGPPSDTIHIKGKEMPQNYSALITETTEQSNGQMLIKWDYRNNTTADKINHFDLYRSPTADGEFVKINNAPIPANQNQFIDPSPLRSNYYRLKLFDVNGYEYESIHTLGQKADSIPPAAPVGGIGKIDDYGNITFTWTPSPEEDILGYRVYFSSFKDSLYSQISEKTIYDTVFHYWLNINTLTKMAYFKFTAEDKHHNLSDFSSVVEILRPDYIAPANPVLFDATARPEGTHLSFVSSSSDDVTKHVLMRRLKGRRIWEPIYSVLGVQNGTHYAFVDQLVTYKDLYQYRVLAYDSSKNYSSSKIVEVRGFDNGIRGFITDFEINKTNYTKSTGTTGTATNINTVSPYPSTVNILQWDYTNKDDLYSFEIYRSVDNGMYQVIDVVYLNRDIHNYDPSLLQLVNRNKFYYIDLNMLAKLGNAAYGPTSNSSGSVPGTNGGTTGPGGNTGGSGGTNTGGGTSTGTSGNGYPIGTRGYSYKILAHHNDGGTSAWSDPVFILVN